MTDMPEFRPQTSANTTVQPWGEHIVTPYTPKEEAVWLEYIESTRDKDSAPQAKPQNPTETAKHGRFLVAERIENLRLKGDL